jgi:lipoate-protein ligase A
MQLLHESHPDEPAIDIALSAALLSQTAIGESGPSIRIFRPGPTAAFGSLDRLHGDLPSAAAEARAAGLTPVMRLGGGHAACYDEDCIIVEIFRPETTVVGDIETRFADLAELVAAAVVSLGIGVAVGVLPGEYCPGRFSIHLTGGPKIAGAAQRVIKGASLTNAVIVVGGGDRLRASIGTIYASLGIHIDVKAAGAIDDHYAIGTADVLDAIRRTASIRYGAQAGTVPKALTALAASTFTRYVVGPRPAADAPRPVIS